MGAEARIREELEMTTQTKLRTKDLTDIALFAVAITVCS